MDQNKNTIIIYGSYGYTGELITAIAAKTGRDILLSGRDEKKLRKQAEGFNLPFKSVDLSDEAALDDLLRSAELVLHCAGPFRHTWKPMIKGCIRNRCHYLDITGEIEVFEGIKSMNKMIEEAGIMAMPGTGFDVVPTDCLSLYLKKQLPDAEKLELAFMGLGGGVSHGTAQTMAENLGRGGAVRENGEIKSVPAAYQTKQVDFGKGEKLTVSIPWGDVSTANFTTGIENIIVYTAMKKKAVRMLKLSNLFGPLLRLNFVKKRIKKWITKKIDGPNKKTRESGISMIWGRVENSDGTSAEARLITPEGYRLTSLTAWLIANKICHGEFKIGYQTPAAVYGEDLILEIEGAERF